MIKDLVSVIIPTYNRAHLIKRSTMSVLNQTYSNLELIIVDDGSTDNTEEVVKSIDDNRVIYIKQSNQGACAARNNGIDHAKGEFIAFHDSDDVWHEDKLEKQIKCLRETGADMVYCHVFYVKNSKERILSKSRICNDGFLNMRLPLGISPQTFLGTKSIFNDEKFDVSMPRYQDFELILRLQKKYKIYCMKGPYVDYYLQNDSISQDADKLVVAWKRILQKHPNFMCDYSESLGILGRVMLRNACRSKDEATRKELIRLALVFDESLCMKIRYMIYKIHIFDLLYLIYKKIHK